MSQSKELVRPPVKQKAVNIAEMSDWLQGIKSVLVTLYRQPGKIDPSSRLSVDRNITGAPDIIGYFELEI